MPSGWRGRFFACILCATAACSGTFFATNQQNKKSQQVGPQETNDACAEAREQGVVPAMSRLTHRQYANTVRSLLGTRTDPTATFAADNPVGGYRNNAAALSVSDALGKRYRLAAESLAAEAVATTTAKARIVPCATTDTACADQFITQFGQRAFRRPLTPTEKARFLALFASGDALYDASEGTAFDRGVRVVVEAMLQSPKFLYRTDASTGVLSDFEVATHLSYLLWNDMPDAPLFQAASTGALKTLTQIDAHMDRMLADERAADALSDFHSQWLQMERYGNLQPDPAVFPNFSRDIGPDLKEENRRFVTDIVITQGKGLKALLTTPVTYVNAKTAKLYGVAGTFDEATMTRVDLDATQRAGLLTHVGFLASFAHTNATAPILRGVFVQRQILCNQIPPPSFAVDPVLPAGQTMRERVTVHTSASACAACHHTMINPTGFAFENYDAAGQYQATDNGIPVDASGEVVSPSGERLPFNNAVEFSAKLASDASVQACYAKNWLRYAYAREDGQGDACAIQTIQRSMAADENYSVKSLLRDLVHSRAFLGASR
jgi:Protein of unknown function (DUF1592)/Protein of unknown function (DUF1588)/Protein of unknown function (DUF1595)/Protein of unknown function (DUF1587)/Protein of unknown function (DUF1585)